MKQSKLLKMLDGINTEIVEMTCVEILRITN